MYALFFLVIYLIWIYTRLFLIFFFDIYIRFYLYTFFIYYKYQ